MMYDNDIEQIILGTCLSINNSYYKICNQIDIDCFYSDVNKYVYQCIVKTAENSKIDILTVSHTAMEMQGSIKDKNLKETVWPYEISQMTSKVISDHNLDDHIRILLHFRSKRKLYETTAKALDQINKGEVPLPDIIKECTDGLLDATNNKKGTEKTVGEGFRDFLENQEKDIKEKLLPTYLPEVDRIIGGFEFSDLIIVAGAASMGKTSFMLRLLQNLLQANKGIGIFSLEMSNNQLLTRLISMETGIKVKNIRYNELDQADWDLIHKCIGKYEDSRFVMDSQTSRLPDVLAKIRQFKIKHDIDIIFIDYLQLVVNNKKKGNREQEVAEIARSLKNLAKELNIVIVALSQLSRALTLRDNKRPMLSDLRESGEIEQAADTIMFAFREEYYNMENPREIQDAEIIIAKGRNVGIGTAYLKFQPSNVKFISPEADGFDWEDVRNANPIF
jgi:replicative DNA helicase